MPPTNMTPQDAPAEDMPAGDRVDSPVEEPAPDDASAAGKITIPLDQPEMAEMFKDCEVGETLTVASKDDDSIVLAKEGYGDQGMQGNEAGTSADPDSTGSGEENPAVAAVIAGKMKR
jgi:hypothetical protein